MSSAADVAIIGGGIVGCAAAAFLAEAGAKVELYERDEVGAAASGRNSGSIQHPFDPVLAELHLETLAHYRALEGLELGEAPAGVLMLAPERAQLEPAVEEIARDCPELDATLLDPAELRSVEPGVAAGLWACRLETGYPVRPVAATRAFARRAFSAGVRFREGEPAWPWVIGGRARGVLAAGVRRRAGSVLVAAGPWTPELIDTTRSWQPIVAVWGVVADVEMDDPPRHVLEEAGVEALAAAGTAGPTASIFSLVATDGQISVGSRSCRKLPSRRRGRAAFGAAASASCPAWRARRSWGRAPARARSRSTGVRSWVSCRRSSGSGWPLATGPGASRPARRPRAWPRTRCWAGPKCPGRCRWSASSSPPRAGGPDARSPCRRP